MACVAHDDPERTAGSSTWWRWLGLAGSLLLALGATANGALPKPDPLAVNPVLRALRDQPLLAISATLAMVGMALLVYAWLRLRNDGRLSVRWITVTAVWWSVPLAVAPPLFSRDPYSYAAQGALLAAGVDPYRYGPSALPSGWLGSVSPAWVDTPAPYGPLFLWLARWAAEFSGGHLIVAILLLRLVAIGGVVLIGVFTPRLARAGGIEARLAQWLVLASPLLLAHYVSGAHNDALMVGLLVAGLACAAERRGVLAAVLLGLAAAVKAPAIVALPFAALLWAAPWRGRWPVLRACLASALIAVATFAAVSLIAGLGTGWVSALRSAPGVSVQWTSIPTGLGIAAGWVVSLAGHPEWKDACLAAFRAAATALTAVALVVLWWRIRRHGDDVRRVVMTCGLALLAVVVLAAAFHPWYALWAIVPLAASVVDPRARTALVTATAALSFLVLPAGYNLARATVVPGVIVDLAITGAAVWVAIRWLRQRGSRDGGQPAEGSRPATGALR